MDKYFIGYTSDLLAGVWQGYEMPKRIDCYPGNYSACIWDDVMSQIYERTKYMRTLKFRIPREVEQLSYDVSTGKPPTNFEDSENIELGWFNSSDPFSSS
jgi:membrane carboxypeptidase/penicillin-binding protein